MRFTSFDALARLLVKRANGAQHWRSPSPSAVEIRLTDERRKPSCP
jgi:hypothetical protein